MMRHWDQNPGTTCFFYHTASNSFKTFNYHLMKEFRDNLVDTWIHSEWRAGDGTSPLDETTVFSSAGSNSANGTFALKLINLSDEPRVIRIEVGAEPLRAPVRLTSLSARRDQFNTPERPNAVSPVVTEIPRMEFPRSHRLEPRSLTVFRLWDAGATPGEPR